MNWNERSNLVQSSTCEEVKICMAVHLFSWVCNRAIMVLGAGSAKAKTDVLMMGKDIEEVWKELLESRLGNAYQPLKDIVEGNPIIRMKEVKFFCFVAKDRFVKGFPITGMSGCRGMDKVRKVIVAAQRVRDFVESFGLTLEERSQKRVQIAIDAANGRG